MARTTRERMSGESLVTAVTSAVRPAIVLWLAIGLTTPASAQGLLEAIGDAIDAAMEEEYEDYYEEEVGPRPQQRWPAGQPTRPMQRVWNGEAWVWVPIEAPVVAAPRPAAPVNELPYRGPGVTIILDEGVGGSVTYVIDGKRSEIIRAGEEHALVSKGKYEIRFSRGRVDGRDLGEARYTVTEGSYHFTVTDKGWELFRDKEPANVPVVRPPQGRLPSLEAERLRP